MAHLGSGSPIRQHHHHSHQEFFQQPCLTLSDKPKLRAQICPAAVSSQLPSLKALPPLPPWWPDPQVSRSFPPPLLYVTLDCLLGGANLLRQMLFLGYSGVDRRY